MLPRIRRGALPRLRRVIPRPSSTRTSTSASTPARDRLRGERRILSDERTALRTVSDRLPDVDAPLSTATVESHYRETVMAVPHYQAEYGDTLPQSLAA